MKSISIIALTLLAAVSALAQPYDATWVSHSGVDGGTCGGTTNPCRTFQGAYNNTASGGTIRAMDAGDYGQIIITRPMVIDGNGVGAFIDLTNNFEPSVEVNSSGLVEIRNLDIHVAATCSFCFGITTSSNLIIENVSITGKPNFGVNLVGGSATIHSLTVSGATTGILAQDVTATISDSLVRYSNNAIVVSGATVATQVLIERSKMISNTTGLTVQNAGAAATARISDCVITNNTTGVSIAGGQLITFRNNTWAGNGTDGSAPFSISLK
jgi:Right handed beta helix region